jgi:hypothetical protein
MYGIKRHGLDQVLGSLMIMYRGIGGCMIFMTCNIIQKYMNTATRDSIYFLKSESILFAVRRESIQ